MKFRKAKFRNLPVSDLIKISYLEMLANDFTEIFLQAFNQDVMRMTTSDWIRILLLPLTIILCPIWTLLEIKRISEHAACNDVGITISCKEFTLYWRSFNDFKVQPYSYLKD